MATEVIMPKLGATQEGATILQWYKNEGDSLTKGEPILEIMTDKINIDVEAEESGVLLKQVYAADTEVPVNTVIAYIGDPGEQVADASQSASVRSDNVPPVDTSSDTAVESTPVSAARRPRATPSARRLAREYGVDLRVLQGQGSGPRNRIQKADVQAYVTVQEDEGSKSRGTSSSLGESRVAGVAGAVNSVGAGAGKELTQQVPEVPVQRGNQVAVTGIRKVVGERMASSAFSAPHVTLTSEVNLTKTVALRERLLPVVEAKLGLRVSFTEIIILAVAKALRKNPMLNASYQGNVIQLYEGVHIGMAVAVSDGLVVPVVRNADRKGLLEIVKECKSLAQAARENRLKLEQLTGGTFTVSNLGMYRVDSFTPIINVGEAAILGVGRLQEKPVVVNGAVEVQPTMTLSLSFDHRVVDGAPAAQFLTDLSNILEQPEHLIL